VVVPLVFQHGAAGTAFTVTVVGWAAFEFVMRVRQRFLSRGPGTVDRSALILLPAMAGSVVLAEVLPEAQACGRIRRPDEPTVSVR
jgi:hypothetical protein